MDREKMTQDCGLGLFSAVPAGLNLERLVLTQTPMGRNEFLRSVSNYWEKFRANVSAGMPSRSAFARISKDC